MNVLIKKPLCRPALFLMAVIACALLAHNAGAATLTYYFHVNGTGPGYGINSSDSLSWDDPLWATAATAAPSTNWATGATLANPGFPRFNSTTTPYNVTANSTEYNAGMFGAAGVTLTINAAGSGNLFVVPNATLTGGLPAQGLFPAGGNLIINAPITGTGAIDPGNSGGGTLYLFGNNTYSGGTVFVSSAVVTYFNNNNAFGTGPININGTTFAPLLGTGGATITLANSWTNLAAGGVNFAADANTPVVLTGPLNLQTFALNLRNNGVSSSPLTWSGPIRGSGTLNFTANNGGMITLSGANTYSGASTIGVGANSGANVTVSISSVNSVSGGSPSSNLGHPTTVANGTIGMGSVAVAATLIYTGPGETSDRVINLAGTTGSATLQADGTGALILSAVNTATGAGAKTLTLQGSNTGANSIGKIVDSSGGATAVDKEQPGTWKLTGANTYTGGTTVNAGTLEISGSIVGGVTNNTGTVRLDSNSALASSASVSLSSAGSVNLNYSGVQPITTLVIDGTPEPANTTWGAPGSGAQNQNAIFTGSGILFVSGSPVIVQQPQSQTVFPDASATFSVVVIGDPSFTYQWKKDGVNLPGANGSSLTISPAEPTDAGAYTVAITNTFGFTNSQPAILTVLATNDYVNAVRASAPIAYWRLNETNGTTANDWVGFHTGRYINVNLNQPGFSAATNSDPGIGLPANASQKGYMVISNALPDFSFPASPFTLEAWAASTNFAAKQRLISSLSLAGGGYGFAILDNHDIELTVPLYTGGGGDIDIQLPSALASGVWYHFVATCDGNNYTFYLNGNPVGTHTVSGFALSAPAGQLALGNNPLTYPTEQLYGGIDEVAIYNYGLDQTTVTNHYLARYSDSPAPTVTTPVVTPPTNYVSLSSTLTESAGGAGLTYQWYKGAGTGGPIAGATDSTLTIGPLQLSDAANYHCKVTDIASHTADSPLAFLAVIPIPASASDLNLTNGLVLHLPFDTDYKDVSGRANNGTPVGSPALASGEVGGGAVHYGTTNGIATNYVTVGVVPDLQFGASTDFSVSYWVRGTVNTNLPFFCDSTNGLAGIRAQTNGYYFGPDNAGDGGWAVGLGSAGHEMTTSGANIINDGNWHNLVHVAKRDGNMTTYLDGAQVDNHAISFITDSVDNFYPANIGQDGTGAQVFTQDQEGDIDDLGVWRRTLTPLEVSGIYLAGATNHISFAPPVNPIVRAALQIVQVSPGQYQIIWPGGGTLQASGDVVGAYTNVPSGTSPYTIPVSSSPQLFYRLKY